MHLLRLMCPECCHGQVAAGAAQSRLVSLLTLLTPACVCVSVIQSSVALGTLDLEHQTLLPSSVITLRTVSSELQSFFNNSQVRYEQESQASEREHPTIPWQRCPTSWPWWVTSGHLTLAPAVTGVWSVHSDSTDHKLTCQWHCCCQQDSMARIAKLGAGFS